MYIRVADLIFEIKNRYAYMEHFAKDYAVELEPNSLEKICATISVDKEEIRYEQEKDLNGVDYPEFYLETLAILRKLVEYAIDYDTMLFHGVAMTFDKKCYLLTAPSGTGKSTHAALWQQYLGNQQVHIINGDKPLIRWNGQEFIAYGTPWCGKEEIQENTNATLSGIVFLQQGQNNVIERLSVGEALAGVMQQVHVTQNNAKRVLELCYEILQTIPIYRLTCNMDEDAVKVCFEAITGQTYVRIKGENNGASLDMES